MMETIKYFYTNGFYYCNFVVIKKSFWGKSKDEIEVVFSSTLDGLKEKLYQNYFYLNGPNYINGKLHFERCRAISEKDFDRLKEKCGGMMDKKEQISELKKQIELSEQLEKKYHDDFMRFAITLSKDSTDEMWEKYYELLDKMDKQSKLTRNLIMRVAIPISEKEE